MNIAGIAAFGLAAIVVGYILEKWADRRAQDDNFTDFHGEIIAYVMLIAWAGFLAGIAWV